MNLKSFAALSLPLLCISMASAQTAGTSATMPKVGAPAPALGFDHLIGATAGAKADWPSLRGKVVVLEFWATWCAPCIAEIPLINSLQASLDPAKVQFISVDDEDAPKVESFLKKKPISGWVGLDTSGKVFERYGVISRPATIVVGPDGRIVSTTLRPEQLKHDELLKLERGKTVSLSTTVNSKVQAGLDAGVKQALAEQMGDAVGSNEALFELRITAAKQIPDGQEPETHIYMEGPGSEDITEATIETLLSQAAGIQKTRLTIVGVLPKTLYNLNLKAPNADKKRLKLAIDMAIASAAGLTIEHKTAETDALVLSVLPGSDVHLTAAADGGFSYYDSKTQVMKCIGASMDQVARSLESALGKPVVNESGVPGTITADIAIPSKDLNGANEAVAKVLGLTLKPATRPIETVLITVPPVATPTPTIAAPKP